jgi:hypothetical protein
MSASDWFFKKKVSTVYFYNRELIPGKGSFQLATAFRPGPEPSRPSLQWASGVLSFGVKRFWLEDGY